MEEDKGMDLDERDGEGGDFCVEWLQRGARDETRDQTRSCFFLQLSRCMVHAYMHVYVYISNLKDDAMFDSSTWIKQQY